MSKTNTALLLGVGALLVVAYMARRKGYADGAANNPIGNSPTKVDTKPGKVTDKDLLSGALDVTKSLIDAWGRGSKASTDTKAA